VSLHKKIISSLALIALVVLFGMTGTAEAQRRGGRVVVAPRVIVGGGYYYRPYFYDPFWFDPWYGFAYGYQYPWGPYGYRDAFRPQDGWVATDYLGIDQGPIVAMIENGHSGLVWRVMRKNPHLRRGLERAGFTGGWLTTTET